MGFLSLSVALSLAINVYQTFVVGPLREHRVLPMKFYQHTHFDYFNPLSESINAPFANNSDLSFLLNGARFGGARLSRILPYCIDGLHAPKEKEEDPPQKNKTNTNNKMGGALQNLALMCLFAGQHSTMSRSLHLLGSGDIVLINHLY
jgi:hypothetical protein